MKPNHMKEAHINQAQSRQKTMMSSIQLLPEREKKLAKRTLQRYIISIKKAQQVQDNCLLLVETVNNGKFVYH